MDFGSVQCRPSSEVIITISLALQPGSSRQSCETTYTLPEPSISAEGRGPVRRFPLTREESICAARTTLLQLLPPLVDLKDRTVVSKQSSIGTITVPLG